MHAILLHVRSNPEIYPNGCTKKISEAGRLGFFFFFFIFANTSKILIHEEVEGSKIKRVAKKVFIELSIVRGRDSFLF